MIHRNSTTKIIRASLTDPKLFIYRKLSSVLNERRAVRGLLMVVPTALDDYLAVEELKLLGIE